MGYVTQPRADAANFTLFVIVFFSTVLRLVSRYYVSRKFGLEDLFITLSVAFLFSYTIIIHNENVVTENLYNFLIDLPKEKQIFSMDQLHSYAYFVRLTIFDNSTESTSI
ncbi:MAG: hypothetical protein M1829_001812 [Trizodia sp. TS-e1964]|nr:MAG: hypothetical protein M1829_001812 [Trizodia sp. TS-e1964]